MSALITHTLGGRTQTACNEVLGLTEVVSQIS